MKRQVEAFRYAFDLFDGYAALLSEGASAVATGRPDRSLVLSLMRDENDGLPADIVSMLRDGARKAAEARPFIKGLLAKAEAPEARQNASTRAKALDFMLDRALDLQSPPEAKIPPPYRYFEPMERAFRNAFPFEVGGPLWTPELRAFQGCLETDANPWRP